MELGTRDGMGRPKAGHKGRPAATERESEEISENMNYYGAII